MRQNHLIRLTDTSHNSRYLAMSGTSLRCGTGRIFGTMSTDRPSHRLGLEALLFVTALLPMMSLTMRRTVSDPFTIRTPKKPLDLLLDLLAEWIRARSQWTSSVLLRYVRTLLSCQPNVITVLFKSIIPLLGALQ